MTAIIRSSNGSSTWRYLVTYKETNSREIQTPPITIGEIFSHIKGKATEEMVS